MTSETGIKIFVSSTMNDLSGVREDIKQIIIKSENIPILAEDIIGPGPVRMMIENKVQSADAYIGIFHKRWGYVPTENNPEGLSVTALEYEISKELGLPRQIFVSSQGKEHQLDVFIKRISGYESGDWYTKYSTLQELPALVALALGPLKEAVKFPTQKAPAVYNPVVEELHNISLEELSPNLTYAMSPNANLRIAAWKSLEAYLDSRRLWVHEAVWEIIRIEIRRNPPRETLHNAIFTMKRMLWTSTKHGSLEVSDLIKNEFLDELKTILLSSDIALIGTKADIAQILRNLFTDCDRFKAFWETWKEIARTIQKLNSYEKTLNIFANDLEYAGHDCKKLVLEELFQLMDSKNELISSRANDISELII